MVKPARVAFVLGQKNIESRPVGRNLDEVPVRVAAVDRRHRPAGGRALAGPHLDREPARGQMLCEVSDLRLGLKAELVAARSWMTSREPLRLCRGQGPHVQL